MKPVSLANVVLEQAKLFGVSRDRFCAKSRKKRVLLVPVVPRPIDAKVLDRRLHRLSLRSRQLPTRGSVGDHPEEVEKAIHPAMAIREHTDRIVETATFPRRGLRSQPRISIRLRSMAGVFRPQTQDSNLTPSSRGMIGWSGLSRLDAS